MKKNLLLYLLAGFFIVAGINHFWNPGPYLSVMPPQIPFPEAANYISGAAEIAGGVGILVSPLRRAAGWGLIALLIAVFPANLHMALNGVPGVNLPRWVLWTRLPLQLPLIWWVYSMCIKKPASKFNAGGNSADNP